MSSTDATQKQRGDNTPSRRNAKKHEYTIFIELGAVMDYMTKLRGVTTRGKYYPNRTSYELSRFPSFDGSDWDLPEPFTNFFEACVTKRDLFETVKPYDFAARDINFLSQNGARVVFFVSPEFAQHSAKIHNWIQLYFPNSRMVVGAIQDVNQTPDIWVARNPGIARYLKKNEQPFVLIDGKENARIKDAIRAVRWDQAGYILRHSQLLDRITRTNPHVIETHGAPHASRIPPHMDVNHGIAFFPPGVGEAATWVGTEKAFTERLLSDDFEIFISGGKPITAEGRERSLKAAHSDLLDLSHKQAILNDYLHQAFLMKLENPEWARWVAAREIEMQVTLRDLEHAFGVHAVTGATKKPSKEANVPVQQSGQPEPGKVQDNPPLTSVTDETNRIKITREDLGLPQNAEARDLIAYFSSVGLVNRPGKSRHSEIIGALSERIALNVMENRGWKVFEPRKASDHKSKSGIPGQVRISWVDASGSTHNADVDGFVQDPQGTFHVIEVKASSTKGLSPRQRLLKTHLDNGGKILNPDCIGLRKDIVQFDATYSVVTFLDQQVQSKRSRNPSRSRSR